MHIPSLRPFFVSLIDAANIHFQLMGMGRELCMLMGVGAPRVNPHTLRVKFKVLYHQHSEAEQ